MNNKFSASTIKPCRNSFQRSLEANEEPQKKDNLIDLQKLKK